MVEVLGLDLGLNLQGAASNSGNLIIWVIIIAIILIIVGIILFLWYQSRVYNRKVMVFENIAGRGYQLVYKDKARLIKLGDAGEELLYLRRKKAYRTAYGSKMGKNEYWFAIGQDGYWYNFVLGDLDAKMGMLDIEPIDRDMRYMHTAIRKNIVDRYQKRSFMEKYGTIIMTGVFLLIMILGIWFLLGEMGDIASAISQSVETAAKLTEQNARLLSSIDNLRTGGSGIIPAAIG